MCVCGGRGGVTHHSLLEVFVVISPVHLVGPRLVKVVVIVGGHDAEGLLLLRVSALYQLKKHSAAVER